MKSAARIAVEALAVGQSVLINMDPVRARALQCRLHYYTPIRLKVTKVRGGMLFTRMPSFRRHFAPFTIGRTGHTILFTSSTGQYKMRRSTALALASTLKEIAR